MKGIFKYLSVILIASFLYSCANPVAPQGGPRDQVPPETIPEESTANPSTNFSPGTVELTFNEWVVLQDAFNQVVVSPPLEFRPEVKLKKRTVIVEFDENEQLKENTTYIINFGDAVKDLHEGNIPPNLRFVFSTGDNLDSLTTQGIVLDADTGEPAKKVLVMLYESVADTVVRTERPYYFAKTDDSGNFQMEYLKAGQYKVFALEDANFNYLFDLSSERIAFQDELVTVTDSSSSPIRLLMFTEEQDMVITDDRTRNFGAAKFVFNKKPDRIEIQGEDGFNNPILSEVKGDTLLVWYTDTSSSAERQIILFSDQEEFRDTLGFKIPSKQQRPIPKLTTAVKTKEIKNGDSLVMEFDSPLLAFDTSFLDIKEDSLDFQGTVSLERDAKEFRKMTIRFEGKVGSTYTLTFKPEAVQDIFGNNIDTTIQVVKFLSEEEFGTLNLKVSLPDTLLQTNYVISVLDPGNTVMETVSVQDTVFRATYSGVSPGRYSVRIIEDENGNGRKDSGVYDLGKQPERIFEKTLPELRKNWELETEVKVEF